MFSQVVACIKGHCAQFFGVDLSTDACNTYMLEMFISLISTRVANLFDFFLLSLSNNYIILLQILIEKITTSNKRNLYF